MIGNAGMLFVPCEGLEPIRQAKKRVTTTFVQIYNRRWKSSGCYIVSWCTHTHIHTFCPVGNQKCRETHHAVGWLKMDVYKRKREPAPCNMCHHRTRLLEHSSRPEANKQSSQTKAAGYLHSSNNLPPQSHTPPLLPPPTQALFCPG